MNKQKELQKEKRKKDREWIKAVGERYKRTCAICGDTKLPNAHHIIPKNFKEARWEVLNGIILCPLHHKWGKYSAHKNPLFFINWLRNSDEDKYIYLSGLIDEIEHANNN